MPSPGRIIIGIDPGSRKTGVGIISLRGQQVSCVFHGHIAPKVSDVALRLMHIQTEILGLIDRFKPHEGAIEKIFTCKNAASALKLGQARGVALAALSALPIGEYTPRAVKLAIVGTGTATKEQVQHMVTRLLKLPTEPQEDAADALAIALCHAHQPRYLRESSEKNARCP